MNKYTLIIVFSFDIRIVRFSDTENLLEYLEKWIKHCEYIKHKVYKHVDVTKEINAELNSKVDL